MLISQVLQSGGDFFLIIKQVDPGMAGSVTCELRKSLPNRKSVLINSTSTYLTIVPPDILHEINSNKTHFKGVFDYTNSKIEIPLKQRELNGNSKNVVSRHINFTCVVISLFFCIFRTFQPKNLLFDLLYFLLYSNVQTEPFDQLLTPFSNFRQFEDNAY